MSISTETALEILGVPSYATIHDVTLRYLSLVVRSIPGSRSSIEDLRYITLAFLTLVFPEKKFDLCMSVGEIYGIFQSFFNGMRFDYEECHHNGSCDYDSEVIEDSEEERKADDTAIELILQEEKEKQKAERKKAKKKRRKEKKKQQKSDQDSKSETRAEKVKLQKPASSDSSSEEDEDEILARRTRKHNPNAKQDIDTSSEFVACIAGNRWITLPAPTITNEDEDVSIQESYSSPLPSENQQVIELKSRQLALLGNQKASTGDYTEAIRLFSEAIKLNPADHRFYGNRSYCYEHNREYEKALRDADKSISLCPTWPKNYFRKGKALLGMQRYDLAEECFLQVLKYDSECEDALSHLHTVKILQIAEFGYSVHEAEVALSKFGSVKEALLGLVRGDFTINNVSEVDVFLSDEECEEFWKPVSKTKQAAGEYDIKKDPKNPEQHNSLWIGNVQPTVTEKMVTNLFSKYGEFISVKVMPEKFCAFVNYKSKASPGKAMAALQGYQLHGAFLEIRFPNLAGETAKPKKKKPVSMKNKTKKRLK
ncbi:uncharacterized protein LOC129229621 isoform X2 [Uloborus diversus]|uniref:uncharacterized protein LOC129229621 isoform X2 n=1 Tax=Uloborus diversus TaxID=327109 RepID=UPI00240A6022|nr:uncharacterized protein LOC129229621 isoform X2 [Uloborus diversus]